MTHSLLMALLLCILKDHVPEGGMGMRVGDLLHRHVVHHLQVLLRFLTLELLNSNLPMVDCEEVDELLVVLDVLVGDLDACLELQKVRP